MAHRGLSPFFLNYSPLLLFFSFSASSFLKFSILSYPEAAGGVLSSRTLRTEVAACWYYSFIFFALSRSASPCYLILLNFSSSCFSFDSISAFVL